MLANHTSGLPRLPDNLEDYLKDSTNPYKFYTQEALYSYLKTYKAKAGALAGKAYNYSNTGAGLLGHILEKASGQTYNNMLRTLITEPLRMEHTFITIPKAESRNLAHVYTEKGSETPIWTMGSMQGAGAIKSTLPNMLLYAKAQLHCTNGTLENALRLTHIITYSNDLNVGLAWHQMKLKGTDIYWHNGGTYGSSSYIAFVPSKNLALVVLANSATSVDDLAIELLKLLNN
jgi:CubicO group peptidase (beta-lactamase class C family)